MENSNNGTPAEQSFTEKQEPTTALSFKVGEREYDVNSASKKIEHADNYIAELKAKETEMQAKIAAMQAQLDQSTKLEEALSKLQQQKSPQFSENTTQQQSGAVESQEELFRRLLKQEQEANARKLAEEANNKAKENAFATVQKALVETYGNDHVDKVVAEKAAAFGISVDAMFAMAKDPEQSKILLNIMGVNNNKKVDAHPSSNYRPVQQSSQNGKFSFKGKTAVQIAEHMMQLEKQLSR